jgi:NitT/TauT family transport system substrate-binding protein
MKRIDFTRALAAGAFSAAAGPVAAQSGNPTVIRLGTNASDDITPLLWAQTSGIFARAGLKVEINKFPSGSVATAAVIGGSLDIARSSLLPLINARSHGIPVELIAAADMSLSDDPTEGIVTLKDSPYKTGKDLNGTTMPIPALHDFDEVATRAWVDATGGDSKTIRFIELPQSAVLAAMQQGRVAAAFMSNPFMTNAIQSGKAHVIGEPNGAIAKRFLITAYCSTAPFVVKNRDAIRRFIDALQRASTYSSSHHAEVIAAVAPFWGIDASLLATMKPTRTASALNAKDIQPLLDAALRYGIIPKPITAKSMMASGVS